MGLTKDKWEPAIRLEDGSIMAESPHTILVMRAIENGISTGLVAGFSKGRRFCPIKIPDSKLVSDNLSRWGVDSREAAGRSIDDNVRARAAVFDKFKRLPLCPAIMDGKTGIAFIGLHHADIRHKYPWIDDLRIGTQAKANYGFRDDTGKFLTREQACELVIYLTGHSTNGRRLLAGEEWITKIESEADAIELGRNLHRRGFSHARMRRDNHRARGINRDYTDLLDIAIKEYHKDDTSRKKLWEGSVWKS